MVAPQQHDVDPVVVVLEWLRAQPVVAELLGGAQVDHVTGLLEAPWPHLVVDDGPAGDLRDLRWDAEYDVALTLYGHPNGAPGKAALRKTAHQLLTLLGTLPDVQEVTETTPVVSRVRPSGVLVYQPLANGQPSVQFGVLAVIHPPRTLPT